MTKLKLILAFFLITNCIGYAQSLGRRATWQAQITWPTAKQPGALIGDITADSPMVSAGLQKGDRILQVNDQKIITPEDWDNANYNVKANIKTILKVKRITDMLTFTVELNPLPKEEHGDIDTFYEDIVSDYGIRQRTIITKPKSSEKLPAIFLIQGLSCSTIEKSSTRSNNWVRLITDLVEKSGMVLMRVDKPGVGDSEGDCGSTDFLTEIAGYKAALNSLKRKHYVDTTKIVVYGNSMGSALAPYFANKHNLAGVISDGTFFKTWYEHMLEIERRILTIEGDSQAQITEKMNKAYIPLYHGMLVEKKSFKEVIDSNPALKDYHRQGFYHMYGRPMTYYHQVQEFNFAAEWEKVKVPVRIRWGTNDWIMSEFDNDMIIKTLEQVGHKDHELYKYPGMDHWSTIHPSYKESFEFKPGKWEDKISEQIITWARYMVG